ncbi:MAG: substrate-binding domain-containing protein [Bacteroidota bacterium]
MNFITKTTSLALIAIVFTACSTKKTTNDLKNTDSNTIHIKGSDTEYQMVKTLADEYMKLHPEITIHVEGGGSNEGIKGLLHSEIDICNSSHIIKNSDITIAKGNNIVPNPIIFSVDAVAIITNYKLCIDSLSTTQITQLLSGKILNWKELGGADIPVTVYGRNKSSGTQDYIKEKFEKGPTKAHTVELKTNEEIVEHVISDIGGIGYVGVGFLLDTTGKPNGKIWAMPIHIDNHKAYSPYEQEAVKSGDYVLTRPLYQYINGVPGGAIEDFILFELTKTGQDIVKRFGFFPINDNQQQINRLKGL